MFGFQSIFGWCGIQIFNRKNMEEIKLIDCHEREFTCLWDGKPCEGIIVVENNNTYLCQNVMNGVLCDNKHGYKYGYKYSYAIFGTNICNCSLITNFKLKDSINNLLLLF